MSKQSVPTFLASASRKLARNTAVKRARKRDRVKSRSLASVIMECVRLRYEGWTGLGIKGRIILLLWVAAGAAALPGPAWAQALADAEISSGVAVTPTPAPPDLVYTRPTQKTKLRNYAFDAFGPYPIAGAAFAAGIGQAYNTPPEWKQGAEGYGRRIGSDFGIAAVSTTTRYGLAQAFKEDMLYYRCECKGVFPRLRHAVVSTLTARRGEDGHTVFSFPALIAPYAGTMTAVYAWYPGRYDGKDALRMGNYTMLGYVGGNIALEFFYSGPHSLLHRMHLNNGRGAPTTGSNP
jgi:hypothetical protein